MLVYAVISAETEKAVETFVRLEDAERFLEEVRADDAELITRRNAIERRDVRFLEGRFHTPPQGAAQK